MSSGCTRNYVQNIYLKHKHEREGFDRNSGTADFADELKKARQFGSMTTFGRGLPRGGEMSAVKSLQRQEDILRALYRRDPLVLCHSYTSSSGCKHF